MKIARDKGKLRGKPPKLSDLQQRELLKMHATGEYSISDLGRLFKVSRPTVYRTIRRAEDTVIAERPYPSGEGRGVIPTGS